MPKALIMNDEIGKYRDNSRNPNGIYYRIKPENRDNEEFLSERKYDKEIGMSHE